MKTNKNLLIAGVISIATLASFAAASAHFGNDEDIRTAVANGDYSVFQEVIKDTPRAHQIDTEKKFNAMREAHQLRSDGKFEEARTMMKDSGLGKTHKRHHDGFMEIHTVVASGDYAAFQEVVKDSRFGEKITSEEDFRKLQRAHLLRGAGEHGQAQTIMKDLGFQRHGGEQGHRPNK